MYYKRAADVRLGSGCLGFSAGSPCVDAGVEGAQELAGYGIEFDAHLNGPGQFAGYEGDPSAAHIALVADSAGQHLASSDDPRVEDNAWHHVRVTVELGAVTVEVDAETVLTWSGELDRTFGGIGFAATTTASETNWHIVDNVTIEITGTGPQTSRPAAPTVSLPLPQLDARSCDLDATPPSAQEGSPTWVEFSNETAEQAVLLEVTSAGLVLLARIDPGERTLHRGAVGDRWLITDARGDCRAAFEAMSTPPEPFGVWLARVTEPAGTRVYRNEGLGFEFLRPDGELVQVLSGAAPGIGALSIGERIEFFVISARGADVEEYAAGALPEVRVTRETPTSIDGLPAVVLEYAPDAGAATDAATFVVRDDVAHVLTFARGSSAEGCAADLATYRMLVSTVRFLGDPDRVPTQLPSPDIEISETLCGSVLTPPAGARGLADLVTSVGCGPLAVGVGDTVVCAPTLSEDATLTCWTVGGEARDCATGYSSLTTSFAAAGQEPISLTACTTEGCQSAVVRVAVGGAAAPPAPTVSSLGCTPLYPRPGAPVTCVPEVSSDASEFCWSAQGALILGESEAVERCSATPGMEFQVGTGGTALLTLRACNLDGVCGAAVQLLPIDSAVAAFTFSPSTDCGAVLVLGEPPPCDAAVTDLPVGEHLVAISACLQEAPFQPAVCASADSTLLVARTLASGAVVDAGQPVEGARVDLFLVSGDQMPLIRRALTGADGTYTLLDPPLSRYRLVVSTMADGDWVEQASFEVEVAADGRTEFREVDLAS
jgi:hypothetical protein